MPGKHEAYMRTPEHARADEAAYERFRTDVLRGRRAAEAMREYEAALAENFRTYDLTNWRRANKRKLGCGS